MRDLIKKTIEYHAKHSRYFRQNKDELIKDFISASTTSEDVYKLIKDNFSLYFDLIEGVHSYPFEFSNDFISVSFRVKIEYSDDLDVFSDSFNHECTVEVLDYTSIKVFAHDGTHLDVELNDDRVFEILDRIAING